MTDKVLCPYCGAEMAVVMSIYFDSPGWGGRTLCKGCDALGPRVTGYKTKADAKAAALVAAQARYLPPNRPLTLDEVKAMETDNWMCTPAWVEFADCKKTIESGQIRLAPNVLEGYGRDYRVWLRKPTQAEMDAAEWGEETHENA